MKRAFIAAIVMAPLAALATPVPGSSEMAAHRAAYRLVLDQARDSGGIQRAEGAMLFEVQDACEGWATRQRFTLTVHDRDGNTIETTSDYSTFESKDGRSLRFSLTQITEGAVTSRVSGEATMDEHGGRVVFQNPAPQEMRLEPGTLFPMLHTIRSLEAARGGQRILVAPLLDGTDANGPQDSTTLILGGWQSETPHPRHASLSNLGSARMRIAFFEAGQSASGTPSYEVSLRYYANGVADELKMDFGEFVIDGALVELSTLPGGC